MTIPSQRPTRSAAHDLVVVAGSDGFHLIHANGSRVAPIVRVPTTRMTTPSLVGSVLARVLETQKPRRILLSVRPRTPYTAVVDPGLAALEQYAQAHSVPLVWIPDLWDLTKAYRVLARSDDDAHARGRHRGTRRRKLTDLLKQIFTNHKPHDL